LFKRTVPLLVAAVLALPAVAAAKSIDVQGPQTLKGHGPVRGQLRSAEGQATVRFQLSGRIVVSGKADDLDVRCSGPRVQTRSHQNRRGLEMVGCLGRRMTVEVTASAFRFGAKARRWLIEIPEGVSGKIHGRLLERPRPRPQPPAAERPADEPEEAEAA